MPSGRGFRLPVQVWTGQPFAQSRMYQWMKTDFEPADAPTSAWVKQLRATFHAISELIANNMIGPVAPASPASQAAARLQHRFLDLLPQLLKIPQETVRHQLAR